jgi:hypothetical protein
MSHFYELLKCDTFHISFLWSTWMWHRMRHAKYFKLLYFLSHFYEVLEFGHVSVSFFGITWFSQNHLKNLHITEMPIAFHLLLRLAYQIITLITAHHTTLTPTRKLNGKTRVHTVFYLDSFGQEMPSLDLVKGQYFHSSFPFRLLVFVCYAISDLCTFLNARVDLYAFCAVLCTNFVS